MPIKTPLKKKRKRRCPEAARCRFFAAVSATMTGISRRLQLEKEKQAARDRSEHLMTCDRKMFRSTFGFLETPQDENRCLHNKENDEERPCLPHWRDHEIRTYLTWRCLDLATRKLGLLAVESCFKIVQPPRTSFLESPAEKNCRHRHKNWPKDAKRQNDSFFIFIKRTCSHLQRKRRRKVGACA